MAMRFSIRPLLLAVLALAALLPARQAWAQNQDFVNNISNAYNAIGGPPIATPTGSCAANCAAPPTASLPPVSPAVPSAQQQLQLQLQAQRQAMMNQAAGQLGNAIGQELGKALFGDPAEEAAEQAAEQARAAAAAQEAALASARAEAEAQARAERLQANLLVGTGADASGTLSMMTGATSDLPMTLAPSASEEPPPQPSDAVQKKVLGALDCAMQQIYASARRAGAQGAQFAGDLRREVAAYQSRAIQPANGSLDSDVGMSTLDLQRQVAMTKDGNPIEGQFIVDAAVANHGDGIVRVMVNSHVAGANGTRGDESQTIVSIGKDGKANLESDASPQVAACIEGAAN